MPQRTRYLTIVAQDPGVRVNGRVLTARVPVPLEAVAAGPRGSRIHVIDYDATTATLYQPPDLSVDDPYEGATTATILRDPRFHSQNVYAIVMRTLCRFELALGRRIGWSFGGHQIKVAPHAFRDSNAFYSKADEALLFGYFRSGRRRGSVFTCLSHDVVAHETTHALLDGLRERYTDPSSPDQAAFHEGFADVVAMLSVFSLPEVVAVALDGAPDARGSLLMGVAKQVGHELSGCRGDALRRSVLLHPSPKLVRAPEFQAPHRRGEILVAAMMNAFLAVWKNRISAMPGKPRAVVVEEGAQAAEHLLTMAIRAIDYSPPTDILFSDYLSALLTADREASPDDSRYRFRQTLLSSFRAFGIRPTSRGRMLEDTGLWEAPGVEPDYRMSHFASMQRDREEVFRFVWQNRAALGLCEEAYTRVQSVRPCTRIGPDGFVLHEAVSEYVQSLTLRADELAAVGIGKPLTMPDSQAVTLYGGGALIFDDYGRLKYHVRNSLLNTVRQTARLKHLWSSGYFDPSYSTERRFDRMHRARMAA